MLVTGDAGVGKSTVLLGWAQWMATEYSTKVLVITTEGISVSYLASTNNCIEVGTLGTEDISLLVGQIESKFGTYTDWDIVVLDGFDAEGTRLISNTLVSLKLLFPCAFLVHCSSTDSVEMSNRTMEALSPLKRDRMGAWTFDDVSAAWDASRRETVPLFPLASLMSPGLFVRQYHLAGGNYRDMLGNECVVRNGILAEAERVTNVGAFLAEMHMDSPKIPDALIVHVRSGSRHFAEPRSRFALQILWERANLCDAHAAAQLRSVNPLWLCWCFELHVLALFRAAANVNRINKGGIFSNKSRGSILGYRSQAGFLKRTFTPKEFRPYDVRSYDADRTLEDVQRLPTSGKLEPVLYTFEKWHQGMLDGAYVDYRRGTLKVGFICATTAELHRLDFQDAADFCKKLCPEKVLPLQPPAWSSQTQTTVPTSPRSGTLSAAESFLRERHELPQQAWMEKDADTGVRMNSTQYKLDLSSVPTASGTALQERPGDSAVQEPGRIAIQMKVKLYVVVPELMTTSFALSRCTFDNVNAIRSFDPAFDPENAEVLHLRFKQAHEGDEHGRWATPD
jgi:hypothetical protein